MANHVLLTLTGLCCCGCAFDQTGQFALLRCANGAVVRCGFAGRVDMGFSYGTCKDERGGAYAILF